MQLVYAVTPFRKHGDEPAGDPTKELAETIKKQINPESWQDKRFKIEVMSERDAKSARLVIQHTYATHKQIARYLANLGYLGHGFLGFESIYDAAAPPTDWRRGLF